MQRSLVRKFATFGLTLAFATVLALSLPLSAAQAQGMVAFHAAYGSSVPAKNSVLKTAPTTVIISFVQPLSPQGLSIVVYGNKGNVVSTSTATISTNDPKTASVKMAGDGSDIYRVDWTTVSAQDNDPTLGAFVFGVDPSGATDKVPPPAATTTTSTGIPGWVAILTAIVGLAVGYLIANLLRNQRPAPTA